MTLCSIKIGAGARFAADVDSVTQCLAVLELPEILQIEISDAAALDSLIQAALDARHSLLERWALDRMRVKYPHLMPGPLPVGVP